MVKIMLYLGPGASWRDWGFVSDPKCASIIELGIRVVRRPPVPHVQVVQPTVMFRHPNSSGAVWV